MNMPKQLAYITAAALAGCAICADKTCWNDLIPGALEDAAEYEKGVWTLSGDGVLTASKDSAKTNPDGTPIQPWLSKPLAGLPKHGAIGLQGMHGGARPYFRNLRVRPLGK